MTLDEHIDYWAKSSDEDFEVFNVLINSKKFLHAMFFGHLMIEKLIKASWIKSNGNTVPPKSHNLVLLVKQTNLNLTQNNLGLLTIINDFNIETRYPDYKMKIHKLLTEEYINTFLPKFLELRECLLKAII